MGLLGYSPPTDTSTGGYQSWLGGLYGGLLGRGGDEQGLNFWTQQLQGGRDPRSVYDAFLQSPEYIGQQGASGGGGGSQLGGVGDNMATWQTPKGVGAAVDYFRNHAPRASTNRPDYFANPSWYEAPNTWGGSAPKGWDPSVRDSEYFAWKGAGQSPQNPTPNFTAPPGGPGRTTPFTFTPWNGTGTPPTHVSPWTPATPFTPGTTGGLGRTNPFAPTTPTTPTTPTNPGTPATPPRPPAININPTPTPSDDFTLPIQPPAGGTPDPHHNLWAGQGENPPPAWYHGTGIEKAMSDMIRQGIIRDPFADYFDAADGKWKKPNWTEAELKGIVGSVWNLPQFQERWGTDQSITGISPAILAQLGLSPFWGSAGGGSGEAAAGMRPPWSDGQDGGPQAMTRAAPAAAPTGGGMVNPIQAAPATSVAPQQPPAEPWSPFAPSITPEQAQQALQTAANSPKVNGLNEAQRADIQQQLAGLDQWERQYAGWAAQGDSPAEISRRQGIYNDTLKSNAIDRGWLQEKLAGRDWGGGDKWAVAQAVQQNPAALAWFQQQYGGFTPELLNDLNNQQALAQARGAAFAGANWQPGTAWQGGDWALNDAMSQLKFGHGIR